MRQKSQRGCPSSVLLMTSVVVVVWGGWWRKQGRVLSKLIKKQFKSLTTPTYQSFVLEHNYYPLHQNRPPTCCIYISIYICLPLNERRLPFIAYEYDSWLYNMLGVGSKTLLLASMDILQYCDTKIYYKTIDTDTRMALLYI